jgi:hypothetical protein
LDIVSLFLFPPSKGCIGKQAAKQVKKKDRHQRQQGAAGENDEKRGKPVYNRVFSLVEFGMDLVVTEFFGGPWMTVHGVADLSSVFFMGCGPGVLVLIHLVYGFSLGYMTVQAIWNRFVEKVGGLTVKGLAIGTCRPRKIVPGDQFRVIMAASTRLCNVKGASALMQSGGDVIVKLVDKCFFGMTDTTAPQGILGDTGPDFLNKCQGPEHWVVMTVLAGGHIFAEWFFLAVLVLLAVDTVF